ncbi:MAG: S1 RNA-binding domain-containing protein, partial [Phycisphaerae bacterium]|nr:S1 RNA-binding domain-containing protein [Phycisphaerae bacterium]
MDIKAELSKPGRDPRKQFELFSFTEGINKIGDLEVGMELPGIVTNITAFGAFVDVGVHQDGLVHISELSDNFIKDPADVVKVHQKVKVRVLEIDIARKRISMSMKKDQTESKKTVRNEKHQPVKPDKKQTVPAHPAKPTKNNNPLGNTLAAKLTFGS